MSAAKKIDLTPTPGRLSAVPTWVLIAPGLVAILEDGTETSRKMARAEIFRMAKLADKYVESQG